MKTFGQIVASFVFLICLVLVLVFRSVPDTILLCTMMILSGISSASMEINSLLRRLCQQKEAAIVAPAYRERPASQDEEMESEIALNAIMGTVPPVAKKVQGAKPADFDAIVAGEIRKPSTTKARP